MLESLRKQIQELESEIAGLEENIRLKAKEKATVAARMQAQVFLESIFAPYIDGLCNGWGLSPEDGLRSLIENEVTLDKLAYENRDALMEFLSQPECSVIVAAARPIGDVSDEWIKDKMGVLLDVMRKIRPLLANTIITTTGGKEWFYESLMGLRDILFGKPTITQQVESLPDS